MRDRRIALTPLFDDELVAVVAAGVPEHLRSFIELLRGIEPSSTGAQWCVA